MRRQRIPNLRSVGSPYHPGLERVEALRAGNGHLANVGPAPLRSKKVWSLFLQGLGKSVAIAHQHATGAEWHEHHLVRVERDGVRVRDSSKQLAEAAAEGQSGAMSRIHVKPCGIFRRDAA